MTRLQSRLSFNLFVTLAFCFCTFNLQAQGLESDAMRGQSSKKNVSVLQNRFFTKSWRPEVGLLVGSFLNEAYTDTTSTGLRAALFFNEWVGGEIQYIRTSVKDSDDRKALNKEKFSDLDTGETVSPDPEVNPIHSIMDYDVVFAPFYGKLNLLDHYIVYSDLYLTGGYSRVDTSQGVLNSLTIGFGERFYFYESLSFRIDFRDRIYTEQRNGKDSRKNSLSIDLGVSYFFR